MMHLNKYNIVTEGTDDRKRGTVAAVKEENEANPLYLIAWHNRPAEWIRAQYLYRVSA